jgi:hypothetical protein
LLLMSIYIIIGLLVLHISEQIFQNVSKTTLLKQFIISFVFSLLVLILPFHYISRYFSLKLGEKNNLLNGNYLFKLYPNLMCKKHLARIKLESEYENEYLRCRIDKNCLKIAYAKKIVGVIGIIHKNWRKQSDYYVTLLNHKTGEITNADYDIVEIHENKEIKDYNAVISKAISFLYNELNRYKPISEVIVRIIGDIEISESTKRLLEKNFLKVEYASN